MRKKSAAAAKIQEKNELSCMWGLFSFLDSHHGPISPKLISNGRTLNKHIIDYPRKLERLTSFDEECRNIQKETELASVAVNQVFIDRKFICKQGRRSKFRPFSDALELLNINEDLFMETPPPKGKYYVTTVCNCSPMQSQSHQDLTTALSNSKDTSFSFREIQRKLKHTFGGGNRKEHSQRRSLFGDDCVCSGVDTISQGKSKQDTKSNRGDDISCLTNTARKKIDFPSGRLFKKQEVDAILEGKRHINSARFKDVNAIISPKGQKSPSNLGRGFASAELDFWPLSPRRDSQCFLGSAQMRFGPYNNCPSPDGKHRTCLSPLRTILNTEVSSCDRIYEECDDTTEVLTTDTSSSLIRGVDTMKSNELLSETNSINIKHQEEHQSPVSVLDEVFIDDTNSPSNIMLQKVAAARRLKPRRLHFEECSFESSTQYLQTNANSEQNYTSQYVHLVLQASCLSWDQISKIRPSSEDLLLDSSSFDEMDFQPSNHSHFDRKLLFDRIKEVLVEIQRSHFHSPRWLTFLKSRTGSCVPLEEVVLDEIRSEAHEYFYILPQAKETSLDQLVAKDLGDPRLWIDVQTENEHVLSHISEEIMQDLILDVVLGFHS